MSNILICISVYKKTPDQVYQCINSIPKYYDIDLRFDGGWEYSLSDYLELIPSSRYHRLDTYADNQGLAKIRNQQLSECSHQYIQFMDADDTLVNDMSGSLDFKKVLASKVIFNHNREVQESRNINLNKTGLTYFCIPSLIFNTEFLKKNKLYFCEDIKVFEDVIFSIRLTELCPDPIVAHVPYYNYNIGTETLSTSNTPRLIQSTIKLIDKILDSDHLNPKLAYSRVTEECLRLIQLHGPLDYVVEVLKPYKFKLFK